MHSFHRQKWSDWQGERRERGLSGLLPCSCRFLTPLSAIRVSLFFLSVLSAARASACMWSAFTRSSVTTPSSRSGKLSIRDSPSFSIPLSKTESTTFENMSTAYSTSKTDAARAQTPDKIIVVTSSRSIASRHKVLTFDQDSSLNSQSSRSQTRSRAPDLRLLRLQLRLQLPRPLAITHPWKKVP